MRLTLGYIRVSSVEQEQGFGPEAQEDRITKYAQENGLSPVQIYRESKSGESLLNRYELHKALAQAETVAEEGGEAHIIFPGLDRLTRDLIDQESVVTRAFRTGVRLHSTLMAENDTLDPAYRGDPMRTAIRQFFGIINQLDRAIIQRRLEGGLVRKAAGGGFTGGRIPFGYRSENQDLVVDQDRAPVVRKVFALHRAGIDQGTTAAVVAGTYPELCSHWQKQQVSRVLSREGLYAQGRFRPRGSDQEVIRPELVILGPPGGPEPVAGLEGVDWDRLPEKVRLDALAAMLGQTQDQILTWAREHRLRVLWRGRIPAIPRESALRMWDLAQGQQK